MAIQNVDRRAFLHHSAAALASLGAVSAIAAEDAGYGELVPVKDETTGQTLIKLPRGFRYLSFGWTNSKLGDGFKTPGAHDGMAVVKTVGNRVTLVRNHEVGGDGKPMGQR